MDEGSVTSVSAIPNTSFFLTGSKDGDVKLWDANKAKLVYHWPKLHDRHTFMQPGYRGFGGVVRVSLFSLVKLELLVIAALIRIQIWIRKAMRNDEYGANHKSEKYSRIL